MAVVESAWNGNIAAANAAQVPLAEENITFVGSALGLDGYDAIISINDIQEQAALGNIEKMIRAFIKQHF